MFISRHTNPRYTFLRFEGEDNPPPPEPEDTDPPPDEAKNTDKGPIPYERFKEVNDQLADLRAWKQEQEKLAKAAKKDEQKREEARLAEQEEYKTLAEQRKARVEELEPLAEKVERYEAALNDLLKGELKSVPAYVKPLLEDRDPAAQLAYIAKHKESWAKPTPPDINDRASGNGSVTRTDEEKQQELAQRFPSLRR